MQKISSSQASSPGWKQLKEKGIFQFDSSDPEVVQLLEKLKNDASWTKHLRRDEIVIPNSKVGLSEIRRLSVVAPKDLPSKKSSPRVVSEFNVDSPPGEEVSSYTHNIYSKNHSLNPSESLGPKLRISLKEASILKKVKSDRELVKMILNKDNNSSSIDPMSSRRGEITDRLIELNRDSKKPLNSSRMKLVKMSNDVKREAKDKFKQKLAFKQIQLMRKKRQ